MLAPLCVCVCVCVEKGWEQCLSTASTEWRLYALLLCGLVLLIINKHSIIGATEYMYNS